jgi:hypothetical protein
VAHELIGVYRVDTAAHLNNVELGRHGRSRSNVWHYAGVNTFRAGRLDELKCHPTVKPVALVADAIKDCTRRGDIALDTSAAPAPPSWQQSVSVAALTRSRSSRALSMSPSNAGRPFRERMPFTLLPD